MKFLINTSTDPYFNLALDEYCLENIHAEEPFFYLWRNRPSVIIGLNQNAYSEVNLEYLKAHDITLSRRVTGGGAVYHDLQNLNYTIVGRKPSPEPIIAALRQLGLQAELTGRNDIFVDGKKVSGYARRVSHNQEIVHGTLMYNVDLETLTNVLDTPESKLQAKGIASVKSRVANLKDYLHDFSSLDDLQAELQSILSEGESEIVLTDSQLSSVREMAQSKFSTWDFIYGHSHEADFRHTTKLKCGTVVAEIQINRGLISSIAFSGDFLFDSPVAELSDALVGIRYEREEVLAKLSSLNVARYFRDSTPAEITALIIA